MAESANISHAETASQRIALVIGMNAAPRSLLPPLRHAEHDAKAVADILTRPECGFVLHDGAPLLGSAVPRIRCKWRSST
jgi:hypothetical protein